MTRVATGLAPRIGRIGLSPTMQATLAAERLRRAGHSVVDLGAGEPDFPTPAHVAAAARAAIDEGFTRYTANAGIADLREAVAERYRRDHDVSYVADQVIVTAGGKQALFHAAMALFGPGDEVITHTPGWPTIPEQLIIAGAQPVPVFLDQAEGFALSAARLLAAATPRTRGLVLNSPANPTGALLPDEEASRLAREAAARDWWVVIDLCYDGLVYDGTPHNLLRIFAKVIRDRLVICGSVSKAYAMTGWRCGWLVGDRSVVAAASALQSHETSNASSIAQRAALAALSGPQACVTVMRQTYQSRRDQLLAWLAEEPRLTCHVPRGAFYVFPDVRALLTPACPTSQDFTDGLLAEEHVVTTPGEAFDAPGYLRLSYAASLDQLREGVTRLIRFARGR